MNFQIHIVGPAQESSNTCNFQTLLDQKLLSDIEKYFHLIETSFINAGEGENKRKKNPELVRKIVKSVCMSYGGALFMPRIDLA